MDVAIIKCDGERKKERKKDGGELRYRSMYATASEQISRRHRRLPSKSSKSVACKFPEFGQLILFDRN